jgi:hypothetical protein
MTWTILATMEASAQGIGSSASERVSLDVEACPNVSAEAVRRILGIEIGDLLLGEQQSSTEARHRLTIRCAGNVAWVEAAGKGGADPLDRTLRLDAFPGDAAPRALALAGLELLVARSPAVRARMQAKQEVAAPSVPVRSTEESLTPRPPEGILRIGLAGTWRSFLVGEGVSAWGGQAQLGWVLGKWQLCADLEAGGASRDVRLGKTGAFLLSGGAAFGLNAGGKNVGLALALGGRLGMARLAGNATDATNVIASAVVRPWGGPMVSLGFSGRLQPLAVVLTVEAGRSLFTAEAQSESTAVLVVGGTWVAISLGMAFTSSH